MKESNEAMYLTLPTPSGWKEYAFSDLISSISTNTKKIKGKEYLSRGIYPVVDQGQEFISGYFNNSVNVINENNPVILFGDHTRIVKYLDFPFVPGADGVKVFTPANGLNPRLLYFLTIYLSHLFPSKGYARHFHHIEKSKVAIPSIETQNILASKIDSLFNQAETGICEVNKTQSKLELYKQSILNSAIRGNLVPQDPTDEPATRLLERIQKEKEKLIKDKKIKKEKPLEPISKDELPFDLPKSWTWCRFSEIAEIKSNLVSPERYKNYPHIAPDNIQKNTGKLLGYRTISEDNVTSPKHLFCPGQILYSKIRPYLSKLVIINFEGLCSADMYPIETYLDTEYLFFYMLSNTFLAYASNSGTRTVLPKINQEELSKILVPIPPLNEQRRIVEKLKQAQSECLNISEIVSDNLIKATQLKQSILKKAFEGQL